MASDRARLQKLLTATTYLAVAATLCGPDAVTGLDPVAFDACELAVRRAIHRHMSEGHTTFGAYEPAVRLAADQLAQSYPDALEIMLGYAQDEISTLILEELGHLPKTLH
jgi:hypothetical protein